MTTYVIQDWLGLFHIFTSNKPLKEIWATWVTTSDTILGTEYAIDTDDLREKLLARGVETIQFYSCREKQHGRT